jgi:outer membrane protein
MFRSWRSALAITAAAAALLSMSDASVAQAQAFKGKSAGDFMIRARALGVIPQESGDVKTAAGADTGLDVEVDNQYVPEVDFSYFLTDNIAFELIAATAKHDAKVAQGGASLGSVRLLPPVLTAQYHFLPKSQFSPYVGAGINYTVFFDENAGQFNSIDYENSFGWALQAGFDYFLTDNWAINVDVKKVWLDTDVKVNGGALTSNVSLDPWLIGVGVAYKF